MAEKKDLCTYGLITRKPHNSWPPLILVGKHKIGPTKGMWVLPGGHVEHHETLDEGFVREIKEETGLNILPDPQRWIKPIVIELPDRIAFIGIVSVAHDAKPRGGDDLGEADWHACDRLKPIDMSPMLAQVLDICGLLKK